MTTETEARQRYRNRRDARTANRALACRDCGVDTLPTAVDTFAEFYMVHDEVWTAAGGGDRDYLCVGCLEARLGRQLTRADFKDVPMNSRSPRYKHYAWWWRSPRLLDRLTATP